MLKNYEKLPNGVIKQKTIINNIVNYDYDYVNDRYNQYGEKGMQMAFLRLGYLLGNLTFTPKKILDVGYGNGDFLRASSNIIKECYGYDISNYPLPENCYKKDNLTDDKYDVITFFDSLEHFNDIDFVKTLNTKFILISLPWCHYFSDKWFGDWKHRREGEHIFHFNEESLKKFMDEQGYNTINISNFEDSIRKPSDDNKNILSGIFQKR